jgi:hypothetical protein
MTEMLDLPIKSFASDIEESVLTSANSTFNNSPTNRKYRVNDNNLYHDMEKDKLDLSKKKHKHQKMLGNMFAYWYKNGEPWFVIGPHCNNITNNRAMLSMYDYNLKCNVYSILLSILGSIK